MFYQVPPATTHVTLCVCFAPLGWCAMLQALGDVERLNDGDFSDGGSAQEAEDPEEPWLCWRCMVWMVGTCGKASITASFWWKIIVCQRSIYYLSGISSGDSTICSFSPWKFHCLGNLWRYIALYIAGSANPRRGLATWWMMPMPSFWRTEAGKMVKIWWRHGSWSVIFPVLVISFGNPFTVSIQRRSLIRA